MAGTVTDMTKYIKDVLIGNVQASFIGGSHTMIGHGGLNWMMLGVMYGYIRHHHRCGVSRPGGGLYAEVNITRTGRDSL